MTGSPTSEVRPKEVFGYLCVDAFLQNLVGVQAIKCAIDLGIVGCLHDLGVGTVQQLAEASRCDERGIRMLCNVLLAEHVLIETNQYLAIAPDFHEALEYRDLLESKIDFANLVAPDLMDHFAALIDDPELFMERARVFSLFDYRRCIEARPSNYEATERWVHFTTALTRYESGVCAHIHDFRGRDYRRMMDIGGNSGEFALQLCRRLPNLTATVVDLPLVCDVGEDHVRDKPEGPRIAFVRGDAVNGELPRGFDLVSFKSMLHDWPDDLASRLLTRAAECVNTGGTILIYERGPWDQFERQIGYSLIPMLLFFRSFRRPEVYQQQLEALGFVNIRIDWVRLEMPFFILTAEKP